MRFFKLVLIAAGTLLLPQGAHAAQQAGVAAGVVGTSHVSGAERQNVIPIASGMDMLRNDRVQSEKASRLQILLLDQTVLTIGPNSDLVIDKFVFDPASQTGEMTANLARGALRYISGSIARANPDKVVIKTATATIGVRGTALFITDDPESADGTQFIGLLGPGANNDGDMKVGGIVVSNDGGVTEVFRAGYGTFVTPGQAPGPAVLTPPRLILHVQTQLTETPKPTETPPAEQNAQAGSPPPATDAPPQSGNSAPPPLDSAAMQSSPASSATPPSAAPDNAAVQSSPVLDRVSPASLSGAADVGTRLAVAGVGDVLGSFGVANVGSRTASQDMIAGTGDSPVQLRLTEDSALSSATLSPAQRMLTVTATDAATGIVTTQSMTAATTVTTTIAPTGTTSVTATEEPTRTVTTTVEPSCLVPQYDGVRYSHLRRDKLWDRYYTAAPRRQRQCVERYSIVKRA